MKKGKPEHDWMDLLKTKMSDPDLTLEGALTEMCRFALYKMSAQPEAVRVSELGDMMAGMAKVMALGGTGQSPLEQLHQWLNTQEDA